MTEGEQGGSEPSNVISLIRGGKPEKSAGVPAAQSVQTMGDALRELARRVDAGEVPMPHQLICIPVDDQGTDTPYLLGEQMPMIEMIGRFEICKQMVMDMMWEERA